MSNRNVASFALVTVQLLSAALVIYFGSRKMLGVLEAVVVIVGGVIAINGVVTMRLGNFRILPIPKAEAILVTSGIYQWIRHPMYTGLLVGTAGFLLNEPNATTGLLWAVLLADLIVKLHFEERMLVERFPEYAEYMNQSKRLIPFVW